MLDAAHGLGSCYDCCTASLSHRNTMEYSHNLCIWKSPGVSLNDPRSRGPKI